MPSRPTIATPSRLTVYDSALDADSITPSMRDNLDDELTEVKSENAVDRITSQANPRTLERVPAGREVPDTAWSSIFFATKISRCLRALLKVCDCSKTMPSAEADRAGSGTSAARETCGSYGAAGASMRPVKRSRSCWRAAISALQGLAAGDLAAKLA